MHSIIGIAFMMGHNEDIDISRNAHTSIAHVAIHHFYILVLSTCCLRPVASMLYVVQPVHAHRGEWEGVSGGMLSTRNVSWSCILELFEAIPLYICKTQA